MSIPKIVERKIVEMKKPDGSSQYIITLPKEYGANLKNKGVNSLLIIFNYGLGAFPKQPELTEKALLTFMQKHPELHKLFTEATKQKETSAMVKTTPQASKPQAPRARTQHLNW
jgi:hypothetical protein